MSMGIDKVMPKYGFAILFFLTLALYLHFQLYSLHQIIVRKKYTIMH